MDKTSTHNYREHLVSVAASEVKLEGNLVISDAATGIVVFAHGSGSGRHSPRNQYILLVTESEMKEVGATLFGWGASQICFYTFGILLTWAVYGF